MVRFLNLDNLFIELGITLASPVVHKFWLCGIIGDAWNLLVLYGMALYFSFAIADPDRFGLWQNNASSASNSLTIAKSIDEKRKQICFLVFFLSFQALPTKFHKNLWINLEIANRQTKVKPYISCISIKFLISTMQMCELACKLCDCPDLSSAKVNIYCHHAS